MIARISGKVVERGVNCLLIDVSGISYEVFLPLTVMQRIDGALAKDGTISLITYHYLHSEPAKNIPILIGFLNEIEKEFFEVFITVSGIGPRAALRALDKPISLIARAINEGDIDFLKSLPGIGQQRAREIVAKLQNKVGKFALIQDSKVKEQQIKRKDIEEEALAVLMQLGYKKSEGLNMLKKAMDNRSDIETAEELLNEVYKIKKDG